MNDLINYLNIFLRMQKKVIIGLEKGTEPCLVKQINFVYDRAKAFRMKAVLCGISINFE